MPGLMVSLAAWRARHGAGSWWETERWPEGNWKVGTCGTEHVNCGDQAVAGGVGGSGGAAAPGGAMQKRRQQYPGLTESGFQWDGWAPGGNGGKGGDSR